MAQPGPSSRFVSLNGRAAEGSSAPHSLAFLDAAFNRAGVGIAVADAEGRVVRANPEFLKITGYSEKDLGRLAVSDLTHPDDSDAGNVCDGRQIGTKPTITWIRKTGETIQVRLSYSPLEHERGGVLTVEDVTAWQRENDALRKQEEIYRVAAEHSSDAIFEWDTKTDRVIIYGASRMGLQESEVPATFAEWCRRIHPTDLEPVYHAIGRHYETREPVTMRYRISRDDGSESLLEVRGSAFWNASGGCSHWIGVMTDITEKQQSEEALSQLAAIVQSCDDAIIGCDLDYRIVSWNKGAERLYGYTAAEVMGRPLSLFAPERPDQAIAEAGDGEHTVRRMESVHLTRSGSCPVSVSISPVLRKDGELSGYSLISHDIGERKRAERKLLHQALHDALTGLPNRRLMRENLEHAISSQEHGRSVGVFFIDIDGFKTINDTLGHVIGDQLLRSVAARLNSCARKADMLSRVGGDEFVLTVSGLHSRHSARLVATKLIDSLRAPFVAGGNEVFIAASIGVSLFPEDSEDPDALLRNADAAMYQAKRAGKNQVHFFTRALSDALRERMEIASGLRLALDRKEFALHFQPVFGTARHRILRFEALLRWQPFGAPEISPMRFIPISEETGWIVPIGKWVLQEACSRAAAWQSGPHAGIGVSVNVSAVQLARADFVGMLAQVLADTGLPPRLLELELTESIFINNPRETARTISRVHALGVTMALDDFGTGYSSLGYLKNLPMDALKVDKSFLGGVGTDPAAVVLVQSLVSLAHSLGMRVVVEGVETSEQFELLNALGCDELQGYLLGRPLADPFLHSLTYPVASPIPEEAIPDALVSVN